MPTNPCLHSSRGPTPRGGAHQSGCFLPTIADIGGVGDFGPVDTERMAKQRDERDIPARVP